MGRGFPSRRNIWCKGREVGEDEGFQELKEGPLGWVTEFLVESGAGDGECWGQGPLKAMSKGLNFIPKGSRERWKCFSRFEFFERFFWLLGEE